MNKFLQGVADFFSGSAARLKSAMRPHLRFARLLWLRTRRRSRPIIRWVGRNKADAFFRSLALTALAIGVFKILNHWHEVHWGFLWVVLLGLAIIAALGLGIWFLVELFKRVRQKTETTETDSTSNRKGWKTVSLALLWVIFALRLGWLLFGLYMHRGMSLLNLLSLLFGFIALVITTYKYTRPSSSDKKPEEKKIEEKKPEDYGASKGVPGSRALQGALWVMLLMTFGLLLVGYVIHQFLWLPLAVMGMLLVLSYVFKPHTQSRDGYMPKLYRLKLVAWLVVLVIAVAVLMAVFNPMRVTADPSSDAFFIRHHVMVQPGPHKASHKLTTRKLSNGVTEVILPAEMDGVYDTDLAVRYGQVVDGVVVDSFLTEFAEGGSQKMTTSGLRFPVLRYSPVPEIKRPIDFKIGQWRESFPLAKEPVASLLVGVGPHLAYVGNGSWSARVLPNIFHLFDRQSLPVTLQCNTPKTVRHFTGVRDVPEIHLKGYVRVWLIVRA